ncbi:kinesin-domain-containing protein [Gonapodya prolifera JEL478]|uniref:Kinesin-like protein n=1 Tax=Gonapodya prolifera (strain JEL478) TaxID=1344416 RepID=A0A139ASM4_GONPJ|nr:kinesin-domain-containing protein [Gonapodya prolifera JEL478]|eukprot:KXS19741.1 kinesin-domain-containing protein [Gonapodya prolifera JEL478]
MEGYHVTVFAYGQTASGKTYTMAKDQPGVIPQAVDDVFDHIRRASENQEFLLRVSYMEIYNEQIKDLLNPETVDLKILEDRRRGVYVSPLKEEIVTSPRSVMKVIQRGESNRHVGTTDFNEYSSRSHTIFQMIIESRERGATPEPLAGQSRRVSSAKPGAVAVRFSQLNLIDLAGSEKATTDLERRKEGAYINKSLLTLGNVISKLTDLKTGPAHIPYRDSKLTRILQSSLSGNAKISVICTVSPVINNLEESHNTLKFAARVKNIRTRAEMNQIMDDKALLQKYRQEIQELRGKLTEMNDFFEKEKLQELTQLKQEKLKWEEEMAENQLVRCAQQFYVDFLIGRL